MTQFPTTPPDHRRRRIEWIVLGVALASAGGVAGVLLTGRELPKRFAVVEGGVLYRSGQPQADELGYVAQQYALRTVLVLREGGPRVEAERQFARERGLNFVHLPIDSRAAISEDQAREFFACVDEPANQPVLVHCSAGRHRTGFLCALYRIERQGWTREGAVEELLSFGFDAEDHAAILDQLRTYQPGTWSGGAVPAAGGDQGR